jgi:hypothetical protein
VNEIEKARDKAEHSEYWANWWRVYGLGEIGQVQGTIFTNWQQIDNNLQHLIGINTVNIVLTPVISILNFWFLPDLLDYARHNKLIVNQIILKCPDYLALDVIPDQLKQTAWNIIDDITVYLQPNLVTHLRNLIDNNINHVLFSHTVNHILFLDNQRNEKLFDLLPFKPIVTDLFIKNYEYEQR